jgi:hypothetical protein
MAPRVGRIIMATGLVTFGLLGPIADATAEGPIRVQLRNDEDRRPADPDQPQVPSLDGRPVRVFTDEQGRTCRTYARQVVIEGEPRSALATVCREPNGRWVLSR